MSWAGALLARPGFHVDLEEGVAAAVQAGEIRGVAPTLSSQTPRGSPQRSQTLAVMRSESAQALFRELVSN